MQVGGGCANEVVLGEDPSAAGHGVAPVDARHLRSRAVR